MLWEFFQWPIDNWRLPFRSNWSSYNGIMYLYGRTELIETKTYKPTTADVELANGFMTSLMEQLTDQLPYTPDSFSIESVLCEYRKTAYGPRVKEYTGWTSSELAIQYKDWKEWWAHDVDMFPILAGLMARSRIVRAVDYDKRYFRLTYETGMLQNVNLVYPTEPDVYQYLDIPHPESMPLKNLFDEWATHDAAECEELLMRHIPASRLHWKRKADQAAMLKLQKTTNTGLGFRTI
jgi:hypothetical protein